MLTCVLVYASARTRLYALNAEVSECVLARLCVCIYVRACV